MKYSLEGDFDEEKLALFKKMLKNNKIVFNGRNPHCLIFHLNNDGSSIVTEQSVKTFLIENRVLIDGVFVKDGYILCHFRKPK